MKNILVLLVFISNMLFGQEMTSHNDYSDLKKDQTYYIFGNDVKFRKRPSLKSGNITSLKIGSAIKIIEKTNVQLNYNGLESYFYKVSYNTKVGYVLGGLISLEKKEREGLTYLFVFKKQETKLYLNIRVVDNENKFFDEEVELMTNDFTIEISNNKGVEGVESILFVNYIAEACGIDGGGVYLFMKDSKIANTFKIQQVSDAGVYWFVEDIVFPNDENGRKGKIIYSREIGNYIDEETNWLEVKKVSRELEWKDGKITPNIDE